MATHSSILAWRTLWTEEPQATVHGVTKSQTGLSSPGSSVYEIRQERILEWVGIPFSRRSSQLRDQTHVSYVSCIGRQVLLTLVPPGKPLRVKAN